MNAGIACVAQKKISIPLLFFNCGKETKTHKNDKHPKHLQHQPPVTRYAREVLKQLALRARHVRGDVDRVCVDALYGFALLCDHVRELREDLAEF